MVDTARELRTSILVSTVFPPLPVAVSRVESDGMRATGEEVVVTTHTILAQCLDGCALRNDPTENARRKARQLDVFRRFLHAMAERGFTFSGPDLHSLYVTFSREHIATYFPEGARQPEVRFMPYDYQTPGDATHTKLVEYICAQSLLFEDPEPIKPADLAKTSFGDLLTIVRDRLGHVATPNERAQISEADFEELGDDQLYN